MQGPDGRARRLRTAEPVAAIRAHPCRDLLRPRVPRQLSGSLGLRGFWMGYFAARAAPLGAVDAGVVTAAFFNFNGTMVRRSIPDAWGFAGAPAVLRTRRTAAAAALRRLHPSVDERAAALVPLLRRVVEQRRRVGSGAVQCQSRPRSRRPIRSRRCGSAAPRCGSIGGTAMWSRSPRPASTAARPWSCLPSPRTYRRRCSVRTAAGRTGSGKTPVADCVHRGLLDDGVLSAAGWSSAVRSRS